MWFQYGGDSDIGSNSWQMTSTNGTRQGQGSQRIENTNENQRSRKLLKICKFLLEVYLELQLYSEAIEQSERKEGMEMGRRKSTDFPRVKEQDYKSTSTHSSKERRKIQSRNGCLRTYHWRSVISRIGKEMETYNFYI